MHSYCVKCRKKTLFNEDQFIVMTKNNRPMIRGTCAECGRTKTQFISKEMVGGDLVNKLNAVTGNIRLPWGKFKGEMHLPGHSFTGPSTRLDLRLNLDDSPKEWSKPINRVDKAAYSHDLAYAAHDDTKNRNIADRKMINELVSIPNPTKRERIERSIVTPIISAKERFGLGIKKNPGRCEMDRSTCRRITQTRTETFPEKEGLCEWNR